MRLRTTEYVSNGHPDKVADQISDAILDEILRQDSNARVAVETMVKDNLVVLGGEINTKATVDYDSLIQNVVKDIGYINPDHGFYYKNLTVINVIGKQSSEIHEAVDAEELGAGDQGFMIGYATSQTDTYMPLGVYISKKIGEMVKMMESLGPDIKTQVTIDEENKRVHSVLVSTMHKEGTPIDKVRETLNKCIKNNYMGLSSNVFLLFDEDTEIHINPAGTWNVGGPVSDCGLTGRKIVVDQYGPYCPIGGGAFSGKDGSKVDRSGAYLSRYIAKNIVESGLVDECRVEISYMIGVAEPTSLYIDTYGSDINRDLLIQVVKEIFPLKPQEIINHFRLTEPLFYDTAKNGHYGNESLPWEQTNFSEIIKEKYYRLC